MQMPHDLLGWLTIGSMLLGGLWWVLKNTIVNAIFGLRNDIAGLKVELRKFNSITDNHEIRLTKLETWKHDKWED